MLRDFLATHPEAWPVRMALIEELVRDGKHEEARLVIRESPSGSQMPGDYQRRIHIALTQGAAGVNSLPPLLGFEERQVTKSKTTPSNPNPREAPPQLPGATVDKSAAPQPERAKPPLPALAKASDNPASSAAPIMRAAKRPLSTDGVALRPLRRPQGGAGRFSDNTPELSRTAIVFVGSVLLLGTILICLAPAMARKPWKTINGDLVAAAAVEFDPKTKMVTLENLQKVRTAYPTKDLDFASQQRLFFSSAFQKTQLLDGVATWSSEKGECYAFLFSFSMLLVVGSMWLAGFVIASRRNPLVAAITSGVGWLTGFILMVTYSFIAERTAAAGVMWFGAAVSLAVVALLVSALYQISYFRGLLIFISHAFLAGIVIYFLLFHADTVFTSSARQFWHQAVFVPSGLVDS